MIEKITNEGSSVRNVREEKEKSKSYGLISYIKNPCKIVEVDEIKLVGGKKKEEALEEANKIIQSLNDEINEKKVALENLEKLVDKLKEYNPPKGRHKSK